MNEQEEFEFRLRFEREQDAAPKGRTLGQSFMTIPRGFLRGVQDATDTLVKGGASLIDTIAGTALRPGVDVAAKAGQDAFKRDYGDSLIAGTSRLAGNIGVTLPIGPLAAGGAKVMGAGPAVVNALRSAGFTTGATVAKGFTPVAINMLTRMGAGGAVGFGSAGILSPEDASTGALIGAALPPSIMVLGKAGGGVANLWRSLRGKGDAAGVQALLNALDENPQALIAKLRAAEPGMAADAGPTVGQALGTPQANVLEKMVFDVAKPGNPLQQKLRVAQPAARAAALERVAPTGAGGAATARADMGNAISAYAIPERATARAATSAKYQSVPQDEAALYLPELSAVRDKYFGRGSFVDRGPADRAVQTAQDIGSEFLEGIKPVKQGQVQNIAQAVRGRGGIRGRTGELSDLGVKQSGTTGIINNKSGRSLDLMAEDMALRGFIKTADPDELVNALLDSAGKRGRSMAYDAPDDAYRAMFEASMGDAPVAGSIPKKVTLGEFDNLRQSIGIEQRAAKKAGNDKLSAALAEMRDTLDKRINEVVAGFGAVDEQLPIQWANALDDARALKLAEVKRFGTGPQRDIFRVGADGQPVIQSSEIAGKFWHQGGAADKDVQSFRRLVEDNPAMLSQFRSMITTEGLGNEAGKNAPMLGDNFAKWVSQRLPGLREAFDPAEVKLLQRIAADITRNTEAVRMGAARAGSDTTQKAANALSLGALDSEGLRNVISRIPLTRGAGTIPLDWMRGVGKAKRANALADLLADSSTTADAIERFQLAGASKKQANELMRLIGQTSTRVLPVAASQ